MKGIECHEFVEGITDLLEMRDPYTRGHSNRVADYARLIGKKIKLDNDYVEMIHIAGHLHDIGKVGISSDILKSSRKFGFSDYKEIQKHSVYGYNILSGLSSCPGLAIMVKGHHERWDGLGYPDRLKGEKINLGSRILAVADSFDAITSKRIYRKQLSIEDALDELERNKWTQFDGDLVDALCSIFRK